MAFRKPEMWVRPYQVSQPSSEQSDGGADEGITEARIRWEEVEEEEDDCVGGREEEEAIVVLGEENRILC